MINGVLLEGVDYVGKTSVAERLAVILNEQGASTRSGRCYLQRVPIIEFLEAHAQQCDSMLERDWYYSTAILVDLFSFRTLEEFTVQDRHWLTQVGRNRFFHKDVEFMPVDLIEERHIPFRFNIMLTSSLEAKMERSQGRPAKSPRDRLLAANPGLHQEYERFLIDLIPKGESWTVIDTTELTIEEVARKVLALIGM
jgi:thymidylate kinase